MFHRHSNNGAKIKTSRNPLIYGDEPIDNVTNFQVLTHRGRQGGPQAATVCLLFLLLIACASPPDLLAFGKVSTSSVDLTGSWVRDETVADIDLPKVPASVAHTTAPSRSGRVIRLRDKNPGRAKSAILFDGLYLSAKKLRLTQEPTALFVKFDLARVEEYRFGEKRDVNIGPISVLRVSGWVDSQYFIRSVTDDRISVQERYFLSDNGLRLYREVQLEGKDIPLKTVRQVFDRVP